MNLADEIRAQIEENKGLKLEIGNINNHLSILEGLLRIERADAQKQVEEAYQQELEDGKAQIELGCVGCKHEDISRALSPCRFCARNSTDYWTAKEFVRGDVVVDKDGTRGIVVSSENNESNLLYVLFKGYRVPQSVVRKHYKKTGEHYDIDKFLDEIKGEGNK